MKYFEFKNPLPDELDRLACEKIWNYLKEIGKINFSRNQLEELWLTFSSLHDCVYLCPTSDAMLDFADWLSKKDFNISD